MKREIVLPDLTPVEWAWIAGFFDGEGSVCVSRGGKNKRPRLTVAISQSKEDALYWIEDSVCGSVLFTPASKLPRRKDGALARDRWCWSCSGRAAKAFLEKVRPYLRVKQWEAEIGIEFQTDLGWRRKLTEEQLQKLADRAEDLKIARVHL